MNKIAYSLAVLVLLLVIDGLQAQARGPKAFSSSTEMIVVTTSDWNAPQGTLQRYQRASSRKKWKAVGEPITVMVGKNGLGWGSGILEPDARVRQDRDPSKKEGDGKAPAGAFRLSKIFGYAAQAEPGWKMPYVNLTSSVECVDDTSSKFYNQVVDRGSVSPDWNSSEHMLRSDDLYRWGILVDHNTGPAKPGSGSCIFIHIWRGPGQATVGCTAMPQAQLESVLAWLDPARQPVLVQLPLAEYKQLKKQWQLPALADTKVADSKLPGAAASERR
jgi:D-alanyl-D-alanine dipeptidase